MKETGETATVILENMGISEVRLSNAVKSLANNSSGLAGAVSLAGRPGKKIQLLQMKRIRVTARLNRVLQ